MELVWRKNGEVDSQSKARLHVWRGRVTSWDIIYALSLLCNCSPFPQVEYHLPSKAVRVHKYQLIHVPQCIPVWDNSYLSKPNIIPWLTSWFQTQLKSPNHILLAHIRARVISWNKLAGVCTPYKMLSPWIDLDFRKVASRFWSIGWIRGRMRPYHHTLLWVP